MWYRRSEKFTSAIRKIWVICGHFVPLIKRHSLEKSLIMVVTSVFIFIK